MPRFQTKIENFRSLASCKLFYWNHYLFITSWIADSASNINLRFINYIIVFAARELIHDGCHFCPKYYYRCHRFLSCRFNQHVVKLKYDTRSVFRCNSTWVSFQMEDLRIWLSWSTTTFILRRTWREGLGFRLISIKRHPTLSHCQEESP